MPEKFTLASQFTDPALESGLVAALATHPEIFWEVIDLLPGDAFTAARREYQEVAAAIEDGRIPPPIEGEPVTDPAAAAETITLSAWEGSRMRKSSSRS